MENEKKPAISPVTPAQEVLLVKILQSKKLKDSEYREFRSVLDKRVICSYDASVLINHILGIMRYRRHFCSKRSKAYKKCHFCNSRDEIIRIEKIHSAQRFWCCETCFLNLDSNLFVAVNGFEEKEVAADLARKYPEDSGVVIEA